MKILITGAAGWIARSLTAQLEKDHELVLVDRVAPEDATIFAPHKGGRISMPLVTKWPYIQAAITDETAMRPACEGVDAIVHLAAGVEGLPEIGRATMEANVMGTFVVLDAARLAGVKRVVAASSINTFGTFYWRISGKPVVYDKLPLTEAFPPEPEDPYSLSKLCGEMACDAFTRAYGIKTASLRFGPVWSSDKYDEVMREGLPPTTSWADDLMSWVHANDIATGIRQAVEAPELPASGAYTLTGPDTRCPEPTMEIIERLRPDLLPTLTEPLVGRAPLVSTARAKAAFGYDPQYRLGP
ncbi:MAG TPA: NAD(P)-dependent oxidoreductase [Capsulimonadaceae bacterium]|jgi:nucleoside-diphosphate-sugar epimerase